VSGGGGSSFGGGENKDGGERKKKVRIVRRAVAVGNHITSLEEKSLSEYSENFCRMGGDPRNKKKKKERGRRGGSIVGEKGV